MAGTSAAATIRRQRVANVCEAGPTRIGAAWMHWPPSSEALPQSSDSEESSPRVRAPLSTLELATLDRLLADDRPSSRTGRIAPLWPIEGFAHIPDRFDSPAARGGAFTEGRVTIEQLSATPTDGHHRTPRLSRPVLPGITPLRLDDDDDDSGRAAAVPAKNYFCASRALQLKAELGAQSAAYPSLLHALAEIRTRCSMARVGAAAARWFQSEFGAAGGVEAIVSAVLRGAAGEGCGHDWERVELAAAALAALQEVRVLPQPAPL